MQNILTVQGIPDREYLERWAGMLGIDDALREARQQAGLG